MIAWLYRIYVSRAMNIAIIGCPIVGLVSSGADLHLFPHRPEPAGFHTAVMVIGDVSRAVLDLDGGWTVEKPPLVVGPEDDISVRCVFDELNAHGYRTARTKLWVKNRRDTTPIIAHDPIMRRCLIFWLERKNAPKEAL